MLDGFTITVIFIVLATGVGAFVRRMKRDKCLRDFAGDRVTLQETDGRIVRGKLNVENTGLEFVYEQDMPNKQGYGETSYVLYKNEYLKMQALLRFHDELSEDGKRQRQAELDRTYHPGFCRRLKRKTQNVFKTVRDSVTEVVNLLISQAKKSKPGGTILGSQDKYVTQMRQDVLGPAGASFEPLLEKYIGHRVVLEFLQNDKVFKYGGVLKDYTAEFIEIMDVDYMIEQGQSTRKTDLVSLRKYAVVRHLGE